MRTCFEYEQRDGPLDESAPVRPSTPYASAKLATQREGDALAPYVCADNRRLRDETGWRIRYGLGEGLERTVGWWKSRG